MTPEQTPDDLRRTAVHEAGHVVLAEIFAMGCREVNNIPDWKEGTGGVAISSAGSWNVTHGWDQRGIDHRGERSALRATAMVLLAGTAAERELLGPDGAGLGSGDDMSKVDRALVELGLEGAEADAVLVRLERATAGLVVRHKAAIAAVADAITEHRHLSGEPLAEVIERVLAHSPAVGWHGPGARFVDQDLAPWEALSIRRKVGGSWLREAALVDAG